MPTTTKYIWDEQNYLAEADGTDTINVVYTNEPQQYGNLISTRISGTTSHHHFDALGSTRQLTSTAPSKTDSWIYDAWGNVVSRSGATASHRLWIGQLTYYADAETGLIWVAVRPFGPTIARWLTVDPLAMTDETTIYLYGQNSPTLRHDPSGLHVDVIFSPERTDGMPWTIFNNRERIIPNSDTLLGFTVCGPKPFVTGSCLECCDCPANLTRCFSPSFIIQVKCQIFINCANIAARNRDVSYVYGHEQAHIENVRLFVEKIQQLAQRFEDDNECKLREDLCTDPLLLGANPSTEASHLNSILQDWLDNEMAVPHRQNAGFPRPPKGPRPPIGMVPPKDTHGFDCSGIGLFLLP